MFENLKAWVDLLSSIATIAAVVVIFFAFRAYIISKKQLNLDAISRCIDYYRDNFVEGVNNKTTDIILLKKYLDFVNEELFYFENDYIINNVAYEWLDGMIDILPIFKNEIVLNEKYCNHNIKELLKPNPRVKKAFTVCSDYDFDMLYSEENMKDRKKMREKLFKEILKILKK